MFVLRPSRIVSYGKGATVRGTLKRADGQPIGSADVRILVREARPGAPGKSGIFTVRYHFQRASTGRFTFRIRLRPNDAYPYARGFSGRIRVRVG